jgi:hypothetical protein
MTSLVKRSCNALVAMSKEKNDVFRLGSFVFERMGFPLLASRFKTDLPNVCEISELAESFLKVCEVKKLVWPSIKDAAEACSALCESVSYLTGFESRKIEFLGAVSDMVVQLHSIKDKAEKLRSNDMSKRILEISSIGISCSSLVSSFFLIFPNSKPLRNVKNFFDSAKYVFSGLRLATLAVAGFQKQVS